MPPLAPFDSEKAADRIRVDGEADRRVRDFDIAAARRADDAWIALL
jgi:hypothetical protein